MHRRTFLKKTLGGALPLAAADLSGISFGQNSPDSAESGIISKPGVQDFSKIRGVNLGAWLVLEKWMVPDIYRGSAAEDEYSLSLDLGSGAKSRLDRHRETFITAEDFHWIRDCGLNAVRLPVGYWALEAPKPYVEASR